MEWNGFAVQCPLVLGGSVNEAEVLGATVWLWIHSAWHKEAPLAALPELLLPAIKQRQYVLACQDSRPVFFMSWAWLDAQAEQHYLTRMPLLVPEAAWQSGERMWVIDWVAPFGHARQMTQAVRSELFPTHCLRSLWHRGAERGKRVKCFWSDQVSLDALRTWRHDYPLCADVIEC